MKHKYCRRKVIWGIIESEVRMGMTVDVAIDEIYAVYGHQTCVTKIINSIKHDKKQGTLNPNLRIV